MYEINFKELEEQKRLKAFVQKERKERLWKFGFSDKQWIFICAGAKVNILSGGNQSGKTFTGGRISMFHSTGIYPDKFPNRLKRYGPQKGRIFTHDFEKGATEVIVPFLDEWLHNDFLEHEPRKNQQGVPAKYTLKNGSYFDIMTYKQERESAEGAVLDWAWFDEPPPRDIFIATLRGLMVRRGICYITATLLSEDWIVDHCEDNNVDVYYMEIETDDNPSLDKREIDTFASFLTPEEIEVRRKGRPQALQGRIYKQFNRAIHVIKREDIKDPEAHEMTRFSSLDPHPAIEHACGWGYVDKHGDVYFYDALWQKGLTLEELAEAMRRKEGNRKIQWRWIDPNIAIQRSNYQKKGFTVLTELASHGIICMPAITDDQNIKHTRVAEYLRYDTSKPIQFGNRPKVFWIDDGSPDMREWIRQMRKYSWKDYTVATAKSDVQKPQESAKHFPDVTAYALVHKPRLYIKKPCKKYEPDNTVTGY